eukprot:m.299093 g.299093  ORF g.299093 m.299093 type:complete len:99 (-) comp55180_c0_seq2:96-392(-)
MSAGGSPSNRLPPTGPGKQESVLQMWSGRFGSSSHSFSKSRFEVFRRPHLFAPAPLLGLLTNQACAHCRDAGHIARDCRVCLTCRQEGHYSSACPNRR